MLTGPGAFVPPERRRVVMVFQDFALFPHLDVAENVAFGLPSGVDRRRRSLELLDLVGLAGLDHRMPHELSGGQQQRVAIARALAAEPRLILLDEPFSNLDPSIRSRVRGEVQALIQTGGHHRDLRDPRPGRGAQPRGARRGDDRGPGAPGRHAARGLRAPRRRAPSPSSSASRTSCPGTSGTAHVTCELGVVPAARALDGPVDVMVRSEQISPADGGRARGRRGVAPTSATSSPRVLRLPSGATIRARWRAGPFVAPGDVVCIRVDGEACVFPRSS